jgi:hypothetical protein
MMPQSTGGNHMKKLVARFSAYSMARKTALDINTIIALTTDAIG